MYSLPYFIEKDQQVVRDFITKYPFAMITGADTNGFPHATQIPIFLEEEGEKQFLRGHMMRNTDHHKTFVQNEKVLVVFTGPHCYVSATWYSDPYQASTWNYMSVHVRGKIKFLDESVMPDVLRKITLYFENGNKESTTVFDNLSPDYTRPLMKAIVAFEIEVTHMENVFKLSQNRNLESFENIISKLKPQGGDAEEIANEMEKRKKDLYKL